ncbi:Protein CBG26891 [Caenorhabditis briggsae]|uniref:Protein CBG26891 n=1 Tax=Caenorhabditis briggsae TaxID=6238 RepID=B6II91_CAEBR|nr:Protein CBG26891 [Caenorhabditis briggsae]CAR99621.1 Protein CBG26891 [Caenorhabditis briggsae]
MVWIITGCVCPAFYAVNFTNDNYSMQWWNNTVDEVAKGYDENHVVAGKPFRPASQQLDCSVFLTCSIQVAPGFEKVAVGLYIGTTKNKVHNITRIAGKDEMFRLECGMNGNYYYNGSLVQVGACISVSSINNP